MQDIQDIINKISATAKYKDVDKRTIERVVQECAGRYGLKRAEGEARRLLHQIWGIYYGVKKLPQFNPDNLEATLRLHQSTAERLPMLQNFYEAIFAVTSYPRTIVDYACGLNPLAFYLLGYDVPESYQAFDIDGMTIKFLNDAFHALNIENSYTAALGDLLLDEPKPADVVFLLKVLPCLELQHKGATLTVLERQLSNFVIVSYPLRSVSGQEKGMLSFYKEQFRGLIKGRNWQIHELIFKSELVFIIDKKL